MEKPFLIPIFGLIILLEFPQKIVSLGIKIAGTYHDEVQFYF